jgi:hypothetical protein
MWDIIIVLVLVLAGLNFAAISDVKIGSAFDERLGAWSAGLASSACIIVAILITIGTI